MLRNNQINSQQGVGGQASDGGDWYSEGGGTAPSSVPNNIGALPGVNPNSPTSVWNNNGQGGSTLHQRSNSMNSGNGGMYGGSSNGAVFYSDQSQGGGENYTQPLSGAAQGASSDGGSYGGYNAQGGAMYGSGSNGGGMNLAKDYGVGAAGDMDNMNGKYGYKANYNTQDDDYDNEPPLLEELGINLGFVWLKFLIVMVPNKDIQTLSHLSKLSFASFSKLIMKSGDKSDGGYAGLGGSSTSTPSVFPPDFDSDMAGPIIAFLVLASLMLLSGKVNFGYIYGFSVCGCALLHGVLELIYVPLDMGGSGPSHGSHAQGPPESPSSLSIWETASTLGYSIIPVIFLAFINVFIPCNGTFGLLLSACACGWCTYAATRLFDARMKLFNNNQFVLVAYPVVLFYAVFCLITIF